MNKYYTLLLYICLLAMQPQAQAASIKGKIEGSGKALEYATVVLNDTIITYSDQNGAFEFEDVEIGSSIIEFSYLGFATKSQTVNILSQDQVIKLDIILEEDRMIFDEIVVTGTKTFKRQTESAIIVNVLGKKTLDNVQACNLSEGLRFQPGLRIETDCQTCNYTQLRMNGLAGGYSQILINGRPIFSPLTGLYGLEQVPVNMIDKIEVIRGGGSSLYGSSAVGGTVNVLTRIPDRNGFTINKTYQNINGQANDFMLAGNGTVINKVGNAGVSLFLNHRNREFYDHNDDNFSEIPAIENNSLGLNAFFLPSQNHKIELSLSHLYEYRYGGEMIDKAAHLALQSEERTHHVTMGSLDYQWNFNNGKSALIAYGAWQQTLRDHYTGIFPDEEPAIEAHLSFPPYGNSLTNTYQVGFQLNHTLNSFFSGRNVLTIGSEYVVDSTFDEIQAYNYLIDQETRDLGLFLQSDWEIMPRLNLLSGIRFDRHNLVDKIIPSPRISLLYKLLNNTQLRLGYGTGFRAPQAFDTDLHIAFSGGGISRVIIDPELEAETSESFNASINFDKPTDDWVAGFTVEGFYTRLNNTFILQPIGEDEFGELFEKRNDQGATVQGITLELRANYKRKVQIETGFTFQSSEFENEVQYIDELPGLRQFIRTPNQYGFANLSLTPNEKFNANLNYVFTGPMILPHFAGAPNQGVDELFTSPSFSELNFKLGYQILQWKKTKLEVYGGVKNLFNSYQDRFDIGKNRDSNFVYGPSQPRIFFAGLRWNM